MKDLAKRAQMEDAGAFAELMQSQIQNMYKAARLWNRPHHEPSGD